MAKAPRKRKIKDGINKGSHSMNTGKEIIVD